MTHNAIKKIFSFFLCCLFALSLAACSSNSTAREPASKQPGSQSQAHTTLPSRAEIIGFERWVQDFKRDAAQQGIRQKTLDAAFANVAFQEKVIALDRKQPEGTMSFNGYMQKVVTESRIKKGRELYKQNKALLDEIGKKYGVQPRFIVALWGIETSYGQNTGGFSVVEALATLAYEGRRKDFFRDELIAALKILDEGHISPANMKGSWAGAMGQSQFMPSSFLRFAVDYNGDGKRDIWGTKEDVFASIANYLSKSGWNSELTWGRKVQLPKSFDTALAGKETRKTLPEWHKLGVRSADGNGLPQRGDLRGWIALPGEEPGNAHMVYDNYDVLLKWNRSLYFASAVGALSDKL